MRNMSTDNDEAGRDQTPEGSPPALVKSGRGALDRRALGPKFRERLDEVIRRSGLNKSAFAKVIGIDRSALSQLFAAKDARLPRAETLAAISRTQGVSLDWLLGLSEDDSLAAEVAPEVAIEERADRADDSRLLEWRREAQGAKIRYVPSNLPDLLRIPEITEHEFAANVRPMIENRLDTDRETLELTRTPQSDMEVCLPRQRLEMLAEGGGVYSGLPAEIRFKQITHMARLVEELFPAFRMFLFDGRAAFSAPNTVFGAKRAAVYMGDMYFVLNAQAHIEALSRHFDSLIRLAEIDARDCADFLRKLPVKI